MGRSSAERSASKFYLCETPCGTIAPWRNGPSLGELSNVAISRQHEVGYS